VDSRDWNKTIKEKLILLNIPYSKLEVYGTRSCNILIECREEIIAMKWTEALMKFCEHVRAVRKKKEVEGLELFKIINFRYNIFAVF